MRRVVRSLALLLGAAGAVAVALWLLRERISGPEIEPVRSHEAAPRFRTAPHVPQPTPGPDDLETVNGIGPVYKRRLASAGIATFAALAAADPTAVAGAVGAPVSFAEDWIAQARDLAG